MDFNSTKKRIALFGCHFSYQTKRLSKLNLQLNALQIRKPRYLSFISFTLLFNLF